jgi:hypothetical protein
MTLLNILRRGDRIHLLTDGAGLNDDALIDRFVSKVAIYPHLDTAIGFRGVHQVSTLFLSSFNSARSFDELRSTFRVTVKRQLAGIGDAVTRMHGPTAIQFDIAVVGWSRKNAAPCGFFMSSTDRPGMPAFKVIEVDSLITPSTDELYAELAPALADPAFNVERDMVGLAEKQRCRVIEPYGPKQIPTSLVGGFLQLTTVGEHEIISKIIHRWPDRVGTKIKKL